MEISTVHHVPFLSRLGVTKVFLDGIKNKHNTPSNLKNGYIFHQVQSVVKNKIVLLMYTHYGNLHYVLISILDAFWEKSSAVKLNLFNKLRLFFSLGFMFYREALFFNILVYSSICKYKRWS